MPGGPAGETTLRPSHSSASLYEAIRASTKVGASLGVVSRPRCMAVGRESCPELAEGMAEEKSVFMQDVAVVRAMAIRPAGRSVSNAGERH